MERWKNLLKESLDENWRAKNAKRKGKFVYAAN